MRGENFRKGLEKSRRSAKKTVASKKRLSKKFLGYETKISRGGKSKIRPGRQTP